MNCFSVTKYYELKWPISRDFSVTMAGIQVEPCESMAEKLGIRQFNKKLFKIRELCYRIARIRIKSIQDRESANLRYDYKTCVSIST